MATVIFETSDTPHITIDECAGELSIGGNGSQVTVEVEGEEGNLISRREGEAISLTARSKCHLLCPRGASLTLRQVKGNLRVRHVNGPLAIEAAHGNVCLRDLGPLAIQSVAGNLEARQVGGSLSLGRVSGCARIRQVKGKLAIERCDGDLNARDLGGAEAREVHGNIWLSSELSHGQEYRLHARGNIKAYFPADSSARCSLEAGGELRCGIELEESQQVARRLTGRWGDGQALVELHAGGNLLVEGDDNEWGIGDRIEEIVEAEMSRLEQRLHEELSGLGDLGTSMEDKMRRKFEKKAEWARHVAEKEAERAVHRAERIEEKARRRAERMEEKKRERGERTAGQAGRRPPPWPSFQWGAPPRPAPKREPVSNEERLAILHMVEQKKISSEEAARLLEALEG
ncbi:MAG: hypothetical protein JW850_17725 [Thermoflexales bacterium]|nr:hypothetical protein [Thermoflexales bacterium]